MFMYHIHELVRDIMTSLASSVLLYADRSLLGFCVFVKLGIYYLFKHPCFYFPTFSFYPLSLIFLIPFSTYFPPPMSSSPSSFPPSLSPIETVSPTCLSLCSPVFDVS